MSFREQNNLDGTRFEAVENGTFPAIRAHEVVAHLPVGFIKFDVEGMEIAILKGRKRPGRRTSRPALTPRAPALQVAIYAQRQAQYRQNWAEFY